MLTSAADAAGVIRGITDSHYYALGRLLLAFTIFWAYIAFFQFLLIWSGDKPEEVVFYLARARGGWATATVVLVLVQFVLPFFALLSYDLKRRRRPLTAVAAWLLVGHYLDLHWLVMPAACPAGPRVHWLDLGGAPRRRRGDGPLRGRPAARRAHGPRPRSGAAPCARLREPMTYRVRNPELHQEEDRVPAWKVLLACAATLVISAVMVTWAVTANDAREAALRPSGVFLERWLGPRHEVAGVREDLFGEHRGRSVLGRQRAVLSRYGWVDRARGVVRIPIDQAIDLVVEGRRP